MSLLSFTVTLIDWSIFNKSPGIRFTSKWFRRREKMICQRFFGHFSNVGKEISNFKDFYWFAQGSHVRGFDNSAFRLKR